MRTETDGNQVLRRAAPRGPRLRRFMQALALVTLVSVGSAVPGGAVERLDVNAATIDELVELPGIGQAKAEAIVAERASRPFTSVDDLERVRGIGPILVDELRPRVSVTQASRD